jgi:predicted ATP-binding protein involved in virulence
LDTTDNIFITDIYIKELRHLKDVTIPITTAEKGMKHLILTGKNGSGKTSTLIALGVYLSKIHELSDDLLTIDKLFHNDSVAVADMFKGHDAAREMMYSTLTDNFYTSSNGIKVSLNVSNREIKSFAPNDLTTAFFAAKRAYKPTRPTSIEKVELPLNTTITEDNSKSFLKYLVFLRNRLTDAHYTKNNDEVKKIEVWFAGFEAILKKIFQDAALYLEYDSFQLNFIIHQTGRNPFDFNTLPDGYATILRIVTELMLRMEKNRINAYDAKGIVLIDEIEAHLHIELQKNILPLLTTFFPNIQFIVSTHSPFILNSIENAVVYDLENHILFEDASELSISGLVKGFFQQTSEYSASMERRINELEELNSKVDRTEADNQRLADLIADLKTLSPLFSPEMYLRFSLVQQNFLKKIPVTA